MRILSFMQNIIANTKKECEMRKVLPYNVKKAYLMMLLALGLAPTFTSCEKDDPQPKQHDTTYTFGIDNPLPSDSQISASADSSLVKEIVFQSDNSSWRGAGSDAIRNYLSPKFGLSTKITGKGDLKNVWVKNQDDSLQFVAWGYRVNPGR